MFGLLKRCGKLRVTEEQELKGETRFVITVSAYDAHIIESTRGLPMVSGPRVSSSPETYLRFYLFKHGSESCKKIFTKIASKYFFTL
jgi:hypothetical protein